MTNELIRRFNKIKMIKLLAAIMIDLIGLATYFLPVFGEIGDLVWGPISGLLILMLFPNRKKMVIFGGLEELLPFTDFIPIAYMAWRLDYVKDKEKTLSEFVNKMVNEKRLVNDILTTHYIEADHSTK